MLVALLLSGNDRVRVNDEDVHWSVQKPGLFHKQNGLVSLLFVHG